MSFSASFNDRPFTSTSARKNVRAVGKCVESATPRYSASFAAVKNSHGSSLGFAKAVVALHKGRH